MSLSGEKMSRPRRHPPSPVCVLSFFLFFFSGREKWRMIGGFVAGATLRFFFFFFLSPIPPLVVNAHLVNIPSSNCIVFLVSQQLFRCARQDPLRGPDRQEPPRGPGECDIHDDDDDDRTAPPRRSSQSLRRFFFLTSYMRESDLRFYFFYCDIRSIVDRSRPSGLLLCGATVTRLFFFASETRRARKRETVTAAQLYGARSANLGNPLGKRRREN